MCEILPSKAPPSISCRCTSVPRNQCNLPKGPMNFATDMNRTVVYSSDTCIFCPERRANHLLSITRISMTFVMANCGGNHHFQHGRIRNNHEREITGTVQDMLETRDVVKDITTKFSVCQTVLATLKIPAVGETTPSG